MAKWLAGIVAAVIAGVVVLWIAESGSLTPLDVSGLSTPSGKGYVVEDDSGLRSGAKAYTDRQYPYSVVPSELEGKTYIQTANDDKFSKGEKFLSFSINKPATVYVGHDTRYQKKPSWL